MNLHINWVAWWMSRARDKVFEFFQVSSSFRRLKVELWEKMQFKFKSLLFHRMGAIIIIIIMRRITLPLCMITIWVVWKRKKIFINIWDIFCCCDNTRTICKKIFILKCFNETERIFMWIVSDGLKVVLCLLGIRNSIFRSNIYLTKFVNTIFFRFFRFTFKYTNNTKCLNLTFISS